MSQKDIDNAPGVRQNTAYLIGRHQGEKHKYTFVVDITDFTDPTKPGVKINIVVDNTIVKQVPITEFIDL